MNDIKEKIADYINQHKSSLLYDIDHRSIEQSVMGLINGNKAAGNILNIDDTTIKERVYKEIGQQEIRQALQIKENGNVICGQDNFMISPRPAVYHDNGTTQPPQQQEKLQINSFDMRILSKYNLIFRQCEFNVELLAHYDFKCRLATFYNCVFNHKCLMKNLSANNVFSMSECIFNDIVNFSGSKFESSLFFEFSIFNEYVNFSECNFHKSASFYGTRFEKPPNFSQAIFKGSLNIVNTNLNFDFENLKERIKQEYQNFNANKEQENKKSLDRFANDFRDSFRNFKSSLIKDNNLLDASNFHKYELYCKEIELDSKNPKIFSKGFIDKWQLFFYRITSNHHTDLLKSFHSLLVVIGIFAFLNIATIIGFNCYCLQNISLSPYTLIAHHNAIIKHLLNCNYISLLGINFALAVVFILLFCFSLCSKIRKIIISLSYFLVLLLLISLPQYIIPTISIFTDKRPLLDPLSIIGGIYTLLFAIIFFSLIKTARKNSIIPH